MRKLENDTETNKAEDTVNQDYSIVEREVNLSLINDKLNYIIAVLNNRGS